MKKAMRAGDRPRRDTLRLLLAAIKQVEIDQQTSLDDASVEAILQKEAKKRQEAIEDFEAGGRADQALGEREELALIKTYLPESATEEEIAALVQAIIKKQGLSGPKDIGLVMRPVMTELRGRADGRLVNKIVRDLLKS